MYVKTNKPGRPRKRAKVLAADNGYDSKQKRAALRKRGIILNPIDKGYVKLAIFKPMIISEVFNFFRHFTENTTTL